MSIRSQISLSMGQIGPHRSELSVLKPMTRRQILDSSKLKELAEDNFKFVENDRKLSKRLENTVGKGEIACYEQFLPFPQCFQKACFPGVSKGVIVWEWVKKKSSYTCFCLYSSIYKYKPVSTKLGQN